MNLIDTLPDGWVTLHAVDQEPSIAFYFGVDPRWTHEVEIGARFGVVYSPNFHVHEESELRPWHYTVFEVEMKHFRPNRPLERAYVQTARRQLFVPVL